MNKDLFKMKDKDRPRPSRPHTPGGGGSAGGKGGDSLSTLEGTLERFVYSNEESAWSVVRLSVAGRPGTITAVGNLLGVQPGENLRLRGRWVQDRRYGEQFRVESYVTVKPATLTGIEKYLASGLVEGIGPVMAARLVKHFGLETLDVIEGEEDRLTEVEGIGPVRSEAIRKAWAEQREIKDVMIFLQSHGVSTTYAIKIYKTYGSRAIAAVREDPYRLAEEIHGIGFKSADRIAARLGIAPDSPRRAAAGVLYSLREQSDEGHVYTPRVRLVEKAEEILGIDRLVIQQAIGELAGAERLVLEDLTSGEAVFLTSLHAAEVDAADRLAGLLAAGPPRVRVDVERAIAWVEDTQGLTLSRGQREAIRRAVGSRVLVITGGPGTGKTTLLNGIIAILRKKGLRIMLCAPTGRAAKRMEEATGRKAKTIHRLLEYSPRSGDFVRDEENPLPADLVVADEVSMVDVPLLHHLLRAVPVGCQLILVGDVDQLPSVGPGSVLRDIIRSRAVDVVRLTEVFRQASESLIVVNAHRINRGEMPIFKEKRGRGDFFFIERTTPEEALDLIKHLVAERIPGRFGLDPVDEVQVISPMHKGTLGAANLNSELQALLNPGGETLVRGGRSFRRGDKVMQVRNNYDLDVFNGDIGRIEVIDESQRALSIRYDGRLVTYDFAELDELVLAYACSIHKAQGSEYPAVVIPIHTQHYVMLQRNLLYTGVTRGRRLVIVVGSRKAMGIAVRNNKIEARHTRLAERLAALCRGKP